MKEPGKVLRPGDRHLTEEEIEFFARTSGAASTDLTATGGMERGLTQHLSACASCQELISQRTAADGALKSLRARDPNGRRDDCPADEDWMKLAAGIEDPAESQKLLDHAAGCDHCAGLLRRATEDFSNDLTPGERAIFDGLESGTPAWQQKLAARIGDTAQGSEPKKSLFTGWTKLLRLPRLTILAGGVAAAVLAAWFGLDFERSWTANRLLAQAYSENRIMDLRIEGARYAPRPAGERGVDEDQSQALSDANALIRRQLKAHPTDEKWLAASARASLLEFRYDRAMKTLQHALDLHPNSPTIMVDMASAYYQSGLKNDKGDHDRDIDYGKAVEWLGRALAQNPDDPVALFNRALAEEKLQLFSAAIKDWNHYLIVDPKGDWSDEARRNLARVEDAVKNKKSSLQKPLLEYGELALLASPIRLSELRGRVEEYLHSAVIEWLPQAFPSSPEATRSKKTQDANAALAALSEVTQVDHRDEWLPDVLAGSHGKQFENGVVLLSRAVSANDHGNYAEGRSAAHAAYKLFQSGGNVAAQLRAQAEEAYAAHLLYDGHGCMALIRAIQPALQKHNYHWLRAETDLEESNCAGLNGDLGRERRTIERGTSEAEKYRYMALFLRGAGFQADASATLGDTKHSFSIASKGLKVFWSSQIDVMKGYNLYTDMDTAADGLRLPNLQVAIWDQATALIDLHPDLVQRAMAHRWYGSSAYLANKPELAAAEFAKASDLFAAAPRTEATARGEMDADIWLAGLEARHGDLVQASARLQKVQENLKRAPSFGTEIGFYSTLADLKLRSNDATATESAVRSSIYLAEWALRTFPSDGVRRQWAKQTEQAYRNLVVWKLRQGDARSALELWEWYKGAEFRAARKTDSSPSSNLDELVPPDAQNPPVVATPTIVAEHLPFLKNRTMVTYAVFQDGTAVWVYDDRGIYSKWIASAQKELSARSTKFRRLCATPDSSESDLRSTARDLYDLLIAPVQDHLAPGRTLAFELDDALATIPVEVLVDPGGHYLLQTTSVINVQGFYQTLHSHPPKKIDSSTTALVVSVASPAQADLNPLPDAEREAEIVAQHFHSVRFLKDSEASLPTIRSEFRNAAIFHFAGHAMSLPEMNGLVLAAADSHTGRPNLINSETLPPGDIQNLQLVVLSACDTNATPDNGDSGTEGLTQAFLRSGVPHVIASHWNVDSAKTKLLMKEFYERLLSGAGPDEALRGAKQFLVASNDSTHPYYWAPFQVQE